MNNISHKVSSLRKATAEAVIKVSLADTIQAIVHRKVPKGDVFEFSRAAGLLAIKKTSDVIPDCHPLPVEFASITHSINELEIIITVEVHTIYKTGVEVEAMHGAAITALTIYDMLKPIDKEIEISHIRLKEKKGGKSEFRNQLKKDLKTAVIVCSDSVAAGKKTDTAGKSVIEKLKPHGLKVSEYSVIADEIETISNKAVSLCKDGFDLLLFTGGTGLSKRDNTPEAVRPLIDREVPGIMEAARKYGQDRTPYAMLSRGVAGFIKDSLVITLPGSKKAAEETIDALFPYVLHLFRVLDGGGHESERE